MAASVTRRDFARLFAVGGSAALFADPAWARTMPQASAFNPATAGSGEAFWQSVRGQFVMPPDLGVLNAANLCPASRPVLEALKRESDSVDRDPSGQNRARLSGEKENTRKALAAFLRVTPEEIVITRNTSEANNMVSSGLDLKAGDEVIIFADNHPSNLVAWTEKAKRFGFTVITIPQVNPHPGMEHYIAAYTKAITARTKVLTFTHLSSSVGDLFPAKELCALARERGILSLVDGGEGRASLALRDMLNLYLNADLDDFSQKQRWIQGLSDIRSRRIAGRVPGATPPSHSNMGESSDRSASNPGLEPEFHDTAAHALAVPASSRDGPGLVVPISPADFSNWAARGRVFRGRAGETSHWSRKGSTRSTAGSVPEPVASAADTAASAP